jgi:hypothetical protein
MIQKITVNKIAKKINEPTTIANTIDESIDEVVFVELLC